MQPDDSPAVEPLRRPEERRKTRLIYLGGSEMNKFRFNLVPRVSAATGSMASAQTIKIGTQEPGGSFYSAGDHLRQADRRLTRPPA